MLKTALLVTLFITATVAGANAPAKTYECTDDQGVLSIQGQPCAIPVPEPVIVPLGPGMVEQIAAKAAYEQDRNTRDAEALGQPTIKTGWPVCVTPSALLQLAKASVENDTRATAHLTASRQCLETGHEIPVTVLQHRSPNAVQVRLYVGVDALTGWTHSEAIYRVR